MTMKTVYYLSQSRRDTVWEVTVAGDGLHAVCTCPGDVWNGHCWHVDDALAYALEHAAEAAERVQTMANTALATIDPGERRLRLVETAPQPITVRAPTALIPTREEILGMVTLANALSKAAGYAIPKDLADSRKCFAVIYTGWENGVRPGSAVQHFFVTNGRVQPDGQIMMGIVQARDRSARFVWVQDDANGAVVELWRNGVHVSTGKWMREEATAAGQIGDGARRQKFSWEGPEGKRRKKLLTDDKGNPIYEDPATNRWVTNWSDMVRWAAVKRACRLGGADLINAIESVGAVVSDAAAAYAVEAGDLPQLETPADNEDKELPFDGPGDGGGDGEGDTGAHAGQGGADAATDAQSEYLWRDAFEQHVRPRVTADEVRAVLGVPADADAMEAIEEWVFRDGEASVDFGASMKALYALIETWRRDHAGASTNEAAPLQKAFVAE